MLTQQVAITDTELLFCALSFEGTVYSKINENFSAVVYRGLAVCFLWKNTANNFNFWIPVRCALSYFEPNQSNRLAQAESRCKVWVMTFSELFWCVTGRVIFLAGFIPKTLEYNIQDIQHLDRTKKYILRLEGSTKCYVSESSLPMCFFKSWHILLLISSYGFHLPHRDS